MNKQMWISSHRAEVKSWKFLTEKGQMGTKIPLKSNRYGSIILWHQQMPFFFGGGAEKDHPEDLCR
jgi:hypothetical protein